MTSDPRVTHWAGSFLCLFIAALFLTLLYQDQADLAYAAQDCSQADIDECKKKSESKGCEYYDKKPTPICGGSLLKSGTDLISCKKACLERHFCLGDFSSETGGGYYGDAPCYKDARAPCCCMNYDPRRCNPPLPPGKLRDQTPNSGSLIGDVRTKFKNAVNVEGRTVDATANLPKYIGEVIKILLGLLGIIFLSMVVYAGFKWLTAAGDEKKVGDSINIINHALFGLAIVVGAYVITHWVVDMITKAANP